MNGSAVELSILEVALMVTIGAILFTLIFIEQYRLRNARHNDRSALAEINSKIESVILDNKELSSLRAQIEQLRINLEQCTTDRWMLKDKNKKLEQEKSILIQGARRGAEQDN